MHVIEILIVRGAAFANSSWKSLRVYKPPRNLLFNS